MKDLFNRRLAWLLIVLMLCTLAPFQALAEVIPDADQPDWLEKWESVWGGAVSNDSSGAATENVYAILYGDGMLTIQSGDTPEAERTVTEIYPVNMSGYASAEEIPWYARRNSIKTANIASAIAPESVAFWFTDCAMMEEFKGVENLKMDRATSMREMFHGCASLKSLDLDVKAPDRWITTNVKDMSGVFSGCSALTMLNLSVLTTPALENLEDAFAGCTGLKKLSLVRWDVSRVTNLKGAFWGCSSLTELNLTGWDTSRVTDMSEMFSQCTKLATIMASGSFATEQVTSSDDMFAGCRSLKGGSGTAYSASHTDKTYARLDAGNAPGYFSAGVFAILYADGTLAFQHGDTSDGRAVVNTFPVEMYNKYGFIPGGSGIMNAPWLANDDYRNMITKGDFVDRISPLNARYWFYGCSNLEEVLHGENLDLSQATELNDIFYGCKKLRYVDVSTWDTSKLIECHGVFYDCASLTNVDVSGWDTSCATNISGLFYGCKNLESVDVSGFDTSKVSNFGSVFRDCAKLTELDVSNWNISNATQIGGMFQGCTSLTELDLSNWDTSKCSAYSNLFNGDVNLKTIWASEKFVPNPDWIVLPDGTNKGLNVFLGCTSLVGGNGTKYDPNHTDYTYLRFDTAAAPGYFTKKALRLADELPLTQDDVKVKRSALGSLSALKVRLESTDSVNTRARFVAAFYDGTGKMVKAFLTQVTVRPGTETVTIPASGVSDEARELRLFALNTQYAPLTVSRRFKLE